MITVEQIASAFAAETQPSEESQAIARLKRGDIGGLEYLVLRYQTQALRTSFLICGDQALAEDIVQTVYIRVYEKIHQFDERRPFAPWFLRCVVNDTLKAVQKRGRHVPLDGDGDDNSGRLELAAVGLELDDIATASERSAAIAATLEKLTPGQRAAIVLRYYLDLSDEEMSAQLNCSPGTIRWRLSVARKRMRDLLPTWLQPGANAEL